MSDNNKDKNISDDAISKDNISEIEGLISASEQGTVLSDIFIHRAYAANQIISEENGNQAKLITKILTDYEDQQVKRNKYKSEVQKSLFGFLMVLIGVLTVAIILWISYLFKYHEDFDIQEIVSLIVSCLTYLGSLLTIFLVMVKYIFPEDEEKNFNDLVSIIIKNHTDRLKNEYDFLTQNYSKAKK